MDSLAPQRHGQVTRRLRAALGGAGLFLVAGPLVGLIFTVAVGLIWPGGSPGFLLDIRMVLVLPFGAYVAGGPPALVTGAVAGAATPDPRDRRAYGVAAAVGATAAAAWWRVMEPRAANTAAELWREAAPGAIAGAACTALRCAIFARPANAPILRP